MSDDTQPLRVAVGRRLLRARACIGIGLAEKGAPGRLSRTPARPSGERRKGSGQRGGRRRLRRHRRGVLPTGAMSEVVDAFGGLDAIVYTTGMGVLAPLADVSAEQWATVVRHQRDWRLARSPPPRRRTWPRSAGSAVYLSSLSASYTAPWPLLGAYAVRRPRWTSWSRRGASSIPRSASPGWPSGQLWWHRRLADRVQQGLGPRGAGQGDQVLDGPRPDAGRSHRRRPPCRGCVFRTPLRQEQFHPLSDPGRPAVRRGQGTPTVVKDIKE